MAGRVGLAFLGMLSISRCVIPLGSKVTAGHRYCADELAFLDLRGTTRDEVIASLGPPLLESQDTQTLVYEWEQTSRWRFVPPDHIGEVPLGTHPSVLHGSPQQWGLFFAYDARGVVFAH
jgi:hypothetical protein